MQEAGQRNSGADDGFAAQPSRNPCPAWYHSYLQRNTLSKALRRHPRGWALPSACLIALIVAATVTTGCATGHAVVPRHMAELAPDWPGPVAWLTPAVAADEALLERWRGGVGPPVHHRPATSSPATPSDEITVVSWNVATGSGDLRALLDTLPDGPPLVLLLQEAFRSGPGVPRPMRPGAFYAGRIGGPRSADDPDDVESLASAYGLHAYYVPSMRNGGPLSDEDRGNAILSSLPLTDLLAIELPFERQRRVAVAATVHGHDADGLPWQLRVVSAHLDNLASLKYGWLGGEFGRARQARALREAIARDGPTVLGGDFNTWFGFSESAFVETLSAFPDTRITDRRATFGGLLRLDHLFFRLDDGWEANFHRGDHRFGSDHFPLIGTIQLR
jgi:endonuclease/exonuclease/phosphatase family metal-dependent hydrolase